MTTAPRPMPFPNPLMESALIVGHTTTATARVWLRLPRGGVHRVTAARAPGGPAVCAVDAAPDPARDHTAVVDLAGLAPDTRYALEVRGPDGEPLRGGAFDAACVRTFPASATCDRLAFGLVSCHLPYEAAPDGSPRVAPTVAMLDALRVTLAAHDARLLVHAGDQVYSDGVDALDIAALARAPDTTDARALALYRAAYRAHWGLDGLARLHAGPAAQYMIWDDHDLSDNWGSRPAPRDPPARAGHDRLSSAARRAYDEYQHAHNPTTAPGQWHYAFTCGPAAFFVLDLRGHRDAAARTLLGAAQWRDFEAWLRASAGAPVRFVVSSVPPHHVPEGLVASATRGDGRLPLGRQLPEALFDRWEAAAFEHELERFMHAMFAAEGEVPIVLGGDIHIATAGEVVDAASGRRLHQWVSSPLTNAHGAINRLKAQVLARAVNAATRWPMKQHFHEQRNNFAVVELVRDPLRGGYDTAFHVYAWDGARARRAFTVHRPPGGGPASCVVAG